MVTTRSQSNALCRIRPNFVEIKTESVQPPMVNSCKRPTEKTKNTEQPCKRLRIPLPPKHIKENVMERLQMEIHKFRIRALSLGVSDHGAVASFIREYHDVYPWLTRSMYDSFCKKKPLSVSSTSLPIPREISLEDDIDSLISDLTPKINESITERLQRLKQNQVCHELVSTSGDSAFGP